MYDGVVYICEMHYILFINFSDFVSFGCSWKRSKSWKKWMGKTITWLRISIATFDNNSVVLAAPYALHIVLVSLMPTDLPDGEPMVSAESKKTKKKRCDRWHNVDCYTRLLRTIANVALLSVSNKSEAASKLACSISRRFFFMFSRCKSAAPSALVTHIQYLFWQEFIWFHKAISVVLCFVCVCVCLCVVSMVWVCVCAGEYIGGCHINCAS